MSSSETGAIRNKTQGRDCANTRNRSGSEMFPDRESNEDALMSVRNKSYPNKEPPKLNGLATFVTGVEGLKTESSKS